MSEISRLSQEKPDSVKDDSLTKDALMLAQKVMNSIHIDQKLAKYSVEVSYIKIHSW
jgi:hypothetical protein